MALSLIINLIWISYSMGTLSNINSALPVATAASDDAEVGSGLLSNATISNTSTTPADRRKCAEIGAIIGCTLGAGIGVMMPWIVDAISVAALATNSTTTNSTAGESETPCIFRQMSMTIGIGSTCGAMIGAVIGYKMKD